MLAYIKYEVGTIKNAVVAMMDAQAMRMESKVEQEIQKMEMDVCTEIRKIEGPVSEFQDEFSPSSNDRFESLEHMLVVGDGIGNWQALQESSGIKGAKQHMQVSSSSPDAKAPQIQNSYLVASAASKDSATNQEQSDEHPAFCAPQVKKQETKENSLQAEVEISWDALESVFPAALSEQAGICFRDFCFDVAKVQDDLSKALIKMSHKLGSELAFNTSTSHGTKITDTASGSLFDHSSETRKPGLRTIL